MKVIEAMQMDRFDEILDAGAELFDALRKIMRERGLDDEDAPAVVCVAAAGALSVSPVPQKNLHEMISNSRSLWRNEGEALDSIEFAPPFREDGVEQRASETSN